MPEFNPKQILYTTDALNDRAKEVAAKYPDAVLQEVQQHNKLPDTGLKHYKAKSDLLVLGKLKSKQIRESGRSSDFIAPVWPTAATAVARIVMWTDIKRSTRSQFLPIRTRFWQR